MMSQNGKRIVSDKYFEKDPFLGPLTSNNNSVTCCLETEKQKPIHCTGKGLETSKKTKRPLSVWPFEFPDIALKYSLLAHNALYQCTKGQRLNIASSPIVHCMICSGILLPSSASLISSLCSSLSSSSVSLVLGLVLTLLGFITFIVSPQLESALTHLVQTWTALAGGEENIDFNVSLKSKDKLTKDFLHCSTFRCECVCVHIWHHTGDLI